MTSEDTRVREARILGDILALTLDEQPGAAASALANIQARAREGGVTAGALKDAWRRLQTEGDALRPHLAPDHGLRSAAPPSVARVRVQLAELQSQVVHAEHLRRQDLTRYGLALRQARLLATIAGMLLGAALTAFAMVMLRHG